MLGLLAGVVACPAAPPEPTADGERPPRILEQAGEFPTPFSVIRAVMALPDGRLVVSDPQENRILLIDFDSGTSRELGRLGDGPGEFRRPGGLHRGPGGSVLVYDQQLQRLLPVLASGVLGEVVTLPVGGVPGSGNLRGPDGYQFDSLGNSYTARRDGDFTARRSLLRRHRLGVAPDTIATLLRPITEEAKGQRRGSAFQEVLFSPRDVWGVAPDGWVAVVRGEPYRAEWMPPNGPAIVGPVIAHEPIEIPHEERELIASGAAGDRGLTTVTVGMYAPGGASGSGSDAPIPMRVEELRFAKVKPAVNLRGAFRPMVDEAGRLWVERSRPFQASRTVFDLFDRSGRLVQRVAVPEGSRLLWADGRCVYAARLDGEGFEHLQRFALSR
jgi:hypothetical protein